jgi:hypothetical protein
VLFLADFFTQSPDSRLDPRTSSPPAPLPQGGEGGVNLNLLPSPPWGRGWSRPALRGDRVRGSPRNELGRSFLNTPYVNGIVVRPHYTPRIRHQWAR